MGYSHYKKDRAAHGTIELFEERTPPRVFNLKRFTAGAVMTPFKIY